MVQDCEVWMGDDVENEFVGEIQFTEGDIILIRDRSGSTIARYINTSPESLTRIFKSAYVR